MNYKCLIVDDEPLAQQVLEKYIEHCELLELSDVCNNAIEAFEKIHENTPHIIFLDINMPKLSGINFLKSLKNPPIAIFTTAYPEFALEGFELNAVDYLLKPFSFERFLKAINKALDLIKIKSRDLVEEKAITMANEKLVIKSEKRLYNLSLNNILFVEAMGDYVKIYTQDQYFVAHETLKYILSRLPADKFMQIHRSYIVSLENFKFIEGNYLHINGNDIPIGQSYKDKLFEKVQNN